MPGLAVERRVAKKRGQDASRAASQIQPSAIPLESLLPITEDRDERCVVRTLRDISFYFGISLRTVEKWAQSGKIPGCRKGGYYIDDIRHARQKEKGVVVAEFPLDFVPVWLACRRRGSL